MAEMRKFNTKIKLRIDTLEAWQSSTVTLMPGEVALATVAATAGTGLTEPVVMAKIGMPDENGNDRTFSQLPWAFHAKASDVLAACKSEEALTAFVNGVIADAGIATDEAMQALAAKVTTAEGKITTLEGEMDAVEAKAAANETAIEELTESVTAQIQAAINALSTVYATKEEAGAIETALNTYKTSNDAAVKKVSDDLAAEISRAKAAEEANAGAISGIKDGATIDSFADVEAALAGKQATGDYATKTEAQGYADAKDGAIAEAKKAGTDAAAAVEAEVTRATTKEGEIEASVTALSTKLTGDITSAVAVETQRAQGEEARIEAKAEAAETNAKAHATSLNTAMDTRVKALEAIDHSHENAGVLDGITAEKVAAWDAAEQNAKDHADDLDEAMAERVAAIEAKFTGEDSVADQISTAVAGEAALREAGDEALEGQISALSTQVTKDIADAVKAEENRAKGEEARIEGLVTAEAARAAGVEAGLEERLVEVETFFHTAEGETIDQAMDTLVEIQKYINEDGAAADQMVKDIAANAKSIEDMDTAYKAADATLQGNIDTLTGVVNTKAAQADLEAATGRITTVEGKVTTLEGQMAAVPGQIEALDTKLTKDISDAVAAEAAIARAAEKANSDAIDALEAKAPTWDAAVQTITAGTGLKATKTGTEVAIDFDEAVTFVFDCGTSAE